MLYIIIPYFVHFHNYLLAKIIVLFIRCEIPKYSLTQGRRYTSVSLTGEAVKIYFCRAPLPSDILRIFFAFSFTRGLNNYFAYSPTKILYSKVKTNKRTHWLRGQMKLWSWKKSITKQLLLHLNASHLYSILNQCWKFSSFCDQNFKEYNNTHTAFLLKHPFVAKGTWGCLLLTLYVLLPSLFLSYPCSKRPT